MTFSIVARCPHTGRLGLGIATFSIGAGGRCEGILAGVGICKTQAYTNRGNDPLAIELLAQGHNPAHVMKMLEQAGLNPMLPKGAYYIMCDIGSWGYPNDVEFSRFLVKDIGVATVPGSSFFSDPRAGKDIIRFTFCKKEETLRAAEERLAKLARPAAIRGQ